MRALKLIRRGDGAGGDARGQIVVMFGLSLMIFLAFTALTIDIGFLLLSQRSYQNAADEAALAGAAYLTRPVSDPCADVSGGGSKHDCARQAAWEYLQADLDLNLTSGAINLLKTTNTSAAGQTVAANDGGDPYRIWVSTPPNTPAATTAGSSASMSTVGSSNQVLFVRVDRNRKTFVGGVMGLSNFNVSSWATAGIFPNRWAVITLRKGQGGVEIDPGDITAKDIQVAGGSELYVYNGDIGGNFGMRVDGSTGTHVYVDSSPPGDEANVYLVDYISCGSSCWGPTQITAADGVTVKEVKKLPSFVQDPDYPAPTVPPPGLWPNGLVDNAPGTLDIPNGDTDTTPYTGSPPDITINAGSVVGDTCAAGGPRLGPGTYDDITVLGNKCLVLDPTWRYTDPELGEAGGRTPVPADQAPGIYYITGQFDVRNNALVVGDGVTIIIRPDGTNNQFSPNGVVDINTGKGIAGVEQKLGAWTTKGATPYSFSAGAWTYQTAQEANPQLYGIGMAFYVLKPTQYSASASDTDNTAVIKMTSSGAGIGWKGVTYAARDNVVIAGQPSHSAIGQLVSWTVTFRGSVPIIQTYDGPGDGFPYLIEPCIQISGGCQ